jgi:ABC-type nitrate/sulfonate/bicarbonate transport system permease component
MSSPAPASPSAPHRQRAPAIFTQGSLLRHVAVMTGTGSIGLVAVFAVDLLSLIYVSWLGDASLTAGIGFASQVLFFGISINIGLSIAGSALVARALGATRWQVFRYVVFPSALVEIITGARLAVGAVYGTLIASEIIAGTSGIGWLILDAGRFLRSDYVFVGIFIIGLMGVALDYALVLAQRRIVHWAGR